MAKGEPLLVRAQALRATGQSPHRVARINSGWPIWAGSRAATSIRAARDSGCQYLPRSVSKGLRRLVSIALAWVFPLIWKPAASTAAVTGSGERPGARSTTSFSVANSTRACCTPATRLTAVSILRAQLGQSIPSTCQLWRRLCCSGALKGSLASAASAWA
ncbi:hypothetical protein D3C85_1139080 [compost metagenome]